MLSEYFFIVKILVGMCLSQVCKAKNWKSKEYGELLKFRGSNSYQPSPKLCKGPKEAKKDENCLNNILELGIID